MNTRLTKSLVILTLGGLLAAGSAAAQNQNQGQKGLRDWPLVVNLIEGGRTPLCSLEELAEMGFFSVGFVLSGLYAAARAIHRAAASLNDCQ